MARTFNGSDTYLESGSYPSQGDEFTVVAWARSTASGAGVAGYSNAALEEGWWVRVRDGVSSGIYATTGRWKEVSTAISSGWHHVGLKWSLSAKTVTGYVDGSVSATTASDYSPLWGTNVLTIGRPGSYDGQYFSGDIAEFAVYTVALNDDEVTALAKGCSPLLVRPSGLLSYWPLIGRASPEPDIVGGYDLTLQNSPSVADHPRIIYPRQRIVTVDMGAGATPIVLDATLAECEVEVLDASLLAPATIAAALVEVEAETFDAQILAPATILAELIEAEAEVFTASLLAPATIAADLVEVEAELLGAALVAPGTLLADLLEIEAEAFTALVLSPLTITATLAEMEAEVFDGRAIVRTATLSGVTLRVNIEGPTLRVSDLAPTLVVRDFLPPLLVGPVEA